ITKQHLRQWFLTGYSLTPAAKISKSLTSSGIELVDGRGTRVLDDKDMWYIEVAGPPGNFDETSKLSQVLSSQIVGYRMTLYTLNMSTDGLSELDSAVFPFSFDA
ncbi:847_t:CDS:2, partial [Dentiscutata erythropus]